MQQIAPLSRAPLAGLAIAALAAVATDDVIAQTRTGAWETNSRDQSDGWICTLSGRFSTLSNSAFFGAAVIFGSWTDGYDLEDSDSIFTTRNPGSRLVSGGANAPRITVDFPLSGRSRLYWVRDHNPGQSRLELLSGELLEDIHQESRLTGAEDAILTFRFPDDSLFGRLPLRGYDAASRQLDTCLDG
ncbi:MAG: hypothetical protein KDK12_17665 [Rhodobacteraceae bacterium]|nr:hypothetical protein [Paracoccaceae bacterium]